MLLTCQDIEKIFLTYLYLISLFHNKQKNRDKHQLPLSMIKKYIVLLVLVSSSLKN